MVIMAMMSAYLLLTEAIAHLGACVCAALPGFKRTEMSCAQEQPCAWGLIT